MKLVWTEPAVADLQAIHNYISRDSQTYARHVVEDILQSAGRLPSHPRMGRAVPEAGSESVRELILGNYRLIYRLGRERIEVLAVVHGSRDLARMVSRPWR